MSASIDVATSLRHAQLLQQETAEAGHACLALHDVHDIRPLLAPLRAEQAGVQATVVLLHPLQLTAIAETLQAMLTLRENVAEAEDMEALAAHAECVSPRLQGLVDEIARAIDLQSSVIRDESSAALASARAQRKENAAELTKEINHWCSELHRQGASDFRTPSIRRGRKCCAVRRGRSGVRRPAVARHAAACLRLSHTSGAVPVCNPLGTVVARELATGPCAGSAERERHARHIQNGSDTVHGAQASHGAQQ